MKKIMSLVLAFVMLFALAACGGAPAPTEAPAATEAPTAGVDTPPATETPKEEEPTAEAEVLRIGHIADMTGTDAATGAEAKTALEFAVKYIGGEIMGRPIEIFLGDSQSTASTAADVAKKLVEVDGVDVILGPTQIGHKSAVAGYLQTVGVPVVFYNPTPTGLIASNEWIVGASGSTPQIPTVMAHYVYEELGYEKIHCFTKDDTGGRTYMEPFITVYTGLGGEVLTERYAQTPTEDYAPYLADLDRSADAIIAWTSGSNAIGFWNAWYGMGLNEDLPVVALFHGAFTDYFIPAAVGGGNPEAAEAMLGTIAPMSYAYNIDSEENAAFVEAWTEEFGGVPIGSNLPGACAQVMLLLKQALEATGGDSSPEVLRDALLAADMQGPEGRTSFEGSAAATKDIFVVSLVRLDDGSYNYSLVKEYKDVPPEGLS